MSRFNGAIVDHPAMFGGGHSAARVGLRMRTVAWGYPAVIEELEARTPDGSHTATSTARPARQAARDGQPALRWCTLLVTLPNVVPTLVVDHRWAEGRPDVPGAAESAETGDLEFDVDYLVSAKDAAVIGTMLTVEVRTALLQRPLQRMAFSGATLMLRTFDGVPASPAIVKLLRSLGAEVLSATPACVSPIDPGRTPMPFPRGWHRDDAAL